VKTLSLHNQSTSQTPATGDPTQALPDPGVTQHIPWSPPPRNTRLEITSGGGPRPDRRARRDLLRGLSMVVLTLLLLWRLSLVRPNTTLPTAAPPAAPPLIQQPAMAFAPGLASPAPIRFGTDAAVRVYLVAPSVPLPTDN
jgi:hypothetical protein